MHPAVITSSPSRLECLDPPVTLLADPSSRVDEVISAIPALVRIGAYALDPGKRGIDLIVDPAWI
ncbi:MAG: hypothetical protein ACTHKL_02900 [Streptosporangiaceae bacterium]